MRASGCQPLLNSNVFIRKPTTVQCCSPCSDSYVLNVKDGKDVKFSYVKRHFYFQLELFPCCSSGAAPSANGLWSHKIIALYERYIRQTVWKTASRTDFFFKFRICFGYTLYIYVYVCMYYHI